MSNLQVNTVIFFNKQWFEGITTKTSVSGLFVGVSNVTFKLYSSDQDGIYEIEEKVLGEWHKIAEGTAYAGELINVDVEFPVMEARVKFTPSVAGTFFKAVAIGNPAVYNTYNNTLCD